MKRPIVLTAMYVGLILLLACQDTKEDLKNASEIAYYKSIGEEIPLETGVKWMEHYRNKNNQEGRLGIFSYTVQATQVEAMLQSVTGLTGVAFHYAIDESGNQHIVMVPVDASLSLWSSIPGRIFVDANTGNEISQSVAQAWAQNYKNAHPFSIWFHFFGKNIFDEIVVIPYFETLDIEPAINILNLTPQLLLVVWNNDLLSLGLGRSKDEDGKIYDASNPCPPCGVH